ncbi:NCS2 family permease [Colwellia sp. 4_MG-2023]|jgi:AGZA family xanthine/uracil permease-like MFS transporter|uniref:NCS2 family permease n=1 Tax=unclassified Colwellia TaxID=196834 RepID=UPI001C095E0F|nr:MULTISPECIES: NCS2 family permease [unclassified Colwellia]MBU2923898.1 NCS2 family permease [Colwellia sp. C2M11]MDO6507641.1 NCS2 family permease [Colwellia sp. 5_MG-2023]MDO6555637.1 NCS2 family permease [Colwellia sp. 4_MG-2023]MDO6653030.1 NCS2 family permease [Colwellia sp. 3_MG-2023]MDO6665983.1 NCS2 family permease [Colwellia sp. 2_MG-2023]
MEKVSNTNEKQVKSVGFLERWFKLSSHKTTVKIEVMAGFTTFVTMSYIMFLNPIIMSKSGMPFDGLFLATCLGAAIATILMGMYANWPVGLAPGMGLNAFFTFTVVGSMGYSWEIALGAVFLSGVLFVLMSVTRLREWMLESIPMSLRLAMTAGVGLFLGFIGLRFTGLVVADPDNIVAIADLTHFGFGAFGPEAPALGFLSFLLISILSYRNVFGAVLIGIAVTTLVAFIMTWVLPTDFFVVAEAAKSFAPTSGFMSYNGLLAIPDFAALEPILWKADIAGAFQVALIPVIVTFLFVNIFDTAGTLMGVAERANLQDENGKIQGLNKSLKADSISSVIGTAFGCSPVTSYVESAAGVSVGGRTGLTAVTIGLLFFVGMFFLPLAQMLPGFAVDGALIYVAMLMMSSLRGLDWDDLTEYAPAVCTTVMMAFTFSISNGIAFGFITYTVLKLGAGKSNEISGGVWALTALFVAKFMFLQH